MWRVLREHVKGFERACGGLREKVLQSRKVSTAENMKFSGKKTIAIKSENILTHFEANLFLYQTLPLTLIIPLHSSLSIIIKSALHSVCLSFILAALKNRGVLF